MAVTHRDDAPYPFDDGTGQSDKTHQGLQAHSVPLGLTFFDNGEISGARGRALPHLTHRPAEAGR
ncbi:hypothetical protein D7V80_27200 [Corallococcus sp. CA054B]|uniref:hypothetical protein n=1 Tax=Corallococcus sp. CA054B TaxID=2316734 RepID=UPI000EA3CF8A|nr:hypothetical protein [Corallococcus sp. CA054B]RKG64392.1 hypothetical protein D7V80_27200 [Corallococcus sp. CA054B]